MKIGIASDHRGYDLKKDIIKYLEKNNIEVIDYGTNGKDLVDYPDFGFKLGKSVSKKLCDFGIAICGSGIGISIACNKVKGIRCAHVNTIYEAYYTRRDNDANIVAIGERLSINKAIRIVETFINTPFSNIDRYIKRIDKINKFEDEHYES